MKVTFLKPIATLAILAFLSVGCGNSAAVDDERLSSERTFTEAEVLGDYADLPQTGEIVYEDLLENIENWEEYDVISLTGMDNNLSIFNHLLRLSGMDNVLDLTDEVTLFVPTNEAFKEMPEERFEFLIDPANRTVLRKFVNRHILPSEVPLMEFDSSQIIETAGEEEIEITTDASGSVVFVGGAEIKKSDIRASDGIIHIVNAPIEPTTDVVAE